MLCLYAVGIESVGRILHASKYGFPSYRIICLPQIWHLPKYCARKKPFLRGCFQNRYTAVAAQLFLAFKSLLEVFQLFSRCFRFRTAPYSPNVSSSGAGSVSTSVCALLCFSSNSVKDCVLSVSFCRFFWSFWYVSHIRRSSSGLFSIALIKAWYGSSTLWITVSTASLSALKEVVQISLLRDLNTAQLGLTFYVSGTLKCSSLIVQPFCTAKLQRQHWRNMIHAVSCRGVKRLTMRTGHFSV